MWIKNSQVLPRCPGFGKNFEHVKFIPFTIKWDKILPCPKRKSISTRICAKEIRKLISLVQTLLVSCTTMARKKPLDDCPWKAFKCFCCKHAGLFISTAVGDIMWWLWALELSPLISSEFFCVTLSWGLLFWHQFCQRILFPFRSRNK